MFRFLPPSARLALKLPLSLKPLLSPYVSHGTTSPDIRTLASTILRLCLACWYSRFCSFQD